MAKCRDCGEYKAISGNACPICNYSYECTAIERDIAGASVLVGMGSRRKERILISRPESIYKKVSKFIGLSNAAADCINEFLDVSCGLPEKLERFCVTGPPEKAMPVGSNIEEDVTGITNRMKENTWTTIRHLIGKHLVKIITKPPDLGIGRKRTQAQLRQLAQQLLSITYRPLSGCLMVSTNADWSPDYAIDSYFKPSGFESVPEIDTTNLSLEVTGGYYSYMRGDEEATGTCPSVFEFRSYHFLANYTFKREDVYLGFSVCKERSIVHFSGPEDSLCDLLMSIMEDTWPRVHLGSFTGDLDAILIWWIDKSRVRDLTGRKDPGLF